MSAIEKIIEKVLIKMLSTEDYPNGAAIINSNKLDLFLNKKCIVRTYSAGVYFGTVVEIQKEEVVMKDARIIYNWSGALTTLDIAQSGISNGKLSSVANNVYLSNAIAVIPCTDKVIAAFDTHPKTEHIF